MRKLIYSILALSTFSGAFGQDLKSAPQSTFGNASTDYLLHINNSIDRSVILNGEIKYAEISGTPYLNNEYVGARIAALPKILLLKYNAFTDEMEVKMDEGYMALIKNYQLGRIEILNGGPVYELGNYQSDMQSKKGYLTVIAEKGDNKIYRRDAVKLYEAKPAATTFEVSKPARFEMQKPVYYLKNGSSVVAIPKDRKKLTELLPLYKNEIATIFKSNAELQKEEKLKEFLKILK